jgi:hypothetical protein
MADKLEQFQRARRLRQRLEQLRADARAVGWKPGARPLPFRAGADPEELQRLSREADAIIAELDSIEDGMLGVLMPD